MYKKVGKVSWCLPSLWQLSPGILIVIMLRPPALISSLTSHILHRKTYIRGLFFTVLASTELVSKFHQRGDLSSPHDSGGLWHCTATSATSATSRTPGARRRNRGGGTSSHFMAVISLTGSAAGGESTSAILLPASCSLYGREEVSKPSDDNW